MTENQRQHADAKRLEAVKGALARRARSINTSAGLVTAAKLARELMPGDSEFGDPLSTAGGGGAHLAGRRVAEKTARRPGVMRELGLGALQLWQAVSEAQGRGHGEREVAILFTDLVGYSQWALEVGDDTAVQMLRAAAQAIEPPLTERGGDVVKWLGDGLMAVVDSPQSAVDALADARQRLQQVEVANYSPQLRAGMHVGTPRKLGGDYLGVDINIAARLASAASANELLISDRALALLNTEGLRVSKRRRLKVKGVPTELATYSVAPHRS